MIRTQIKLIVVCMVVILAVVIYLTRYQVVPAGQGYYQINRITGKVQYGVVLKDGRVYLFEQGKVTYRQEPVVPQAMPTQKKGKK